MARHKEGGLINAVARMDVYDRRFAALFLAIILYGLWGSPTPDMIGWPEITIGVLLLYATGYGSFVRVMRLPEDDRGWQHIGKIVFLVCLPLPLLVGQVNGNSPIQALRDILPFVFLLLPVFLYELAAKKEGYRSLLTIAVAGAGMMFALRVLMPLLLDGTPLSRWSLPQPADPFYLANAPTVLFAGLFFVGMAGFEIYRADTKYAVPYAFFLLFLGFSPLAAMALIMQRASMGMLVGTLIFLMIFSFYRKPERALLPFLTAVLIAYLARDVVAEVYHSLMHKTALVGVNMRGAEARAVLDEVDGSFWSVVFGKGWGTTFKSPAVGGVIVNFTHSLITTYLLKTGLTGLSLVGLYLFDLGRKLVALLFRLPVIGLALFAPFIIDIFLYASFKSLDFGLLLLLISLWVDVPARLNQGAGYSTKEEIKQA